MPTRYFRSRLRGTLQRLCHWWAWLPLRFRRLTGHVGKARLLSGHWHLELLFLSLDLLGVFDLYETLTEWVKWSVRPLRPQEEQLLRQVFGEGLVYDRIRIDESALIGPPQARFCYVSFFTINSWGRMSPATLVHEAVHCWQYAHGGAVYIPRALRAQRSVMGYNYGGEPALRAALASGRGLQHFNYEQQADLITDAWCLGAGLSPRWVRPGVDRRLFLPFLRELRQPVN